VSQDCRIWKIVVAGHRIPIFTRSRKSSIPTHVFLSFLPSGTDIGRDQVPTSLNSGLSSTTSAPPNPIERQEPPSPPHSSHPTPHAEKKHYQNCSLASLTRSCEYCCPSAFSISVFASRGTRTVRENPWVWRDCLQYLTVGGEVFVIDDDGDGGGLC